MRDKTRPERGGVLVIVALVLVVLLGFVALVIDLGWLRYAGVQLQAGVDAAALAGADSLHREPELLRVQAIGVAAMHQVAGEDLALAAGDVEIGTWDADSQVFLVSDEDIGNAVRVTHRVDDVTAFLGPLLGHGSLAVTRRAIAGRRGGGATCGILAENYAKLNGSILVDSYDSSAGTYDETTGDNGSVCSNLDLECNGAAEIYGSLLAGPSGELVSDCTVMGEEGRLPAPIPLPEVDCSDARASNNNHLVAPYMKGDDFKANSSDDLELPPGTYYFEKFEVNANAAVRINGEVVVCIENGGAKLNGDAFINTSEDPSLFTIMVADESKLTLNGNAEFYGSFIAPLSEEVKLNGNLDFYGIVIGYDVYLNGNLNFHADESLMDALGFTQYATRLLF